MTSPAGARGPAPATRPPMLVGDDELPTAGPVSVDSISTAHGFGYQRGRGR